MFDDDEEHEFEPESVTSQVWLDDPCTTVFKLVKKSDVAFRLRGDAMLPCIKSRDVIGGMQEGERHGGASSHNRSTEWYHSHLVAWPLLTKSGGGTLYISGGL
eukprot:10691283-Karenia_brevis.AAC.1